MVLPLGSIGKVVLKYHEYMNSHKVRSIEIVSASLYKYFQLTPTHIHASHVPTKVEGQWWSIGRLH